MEKIRDVLVSFPLPKLHILKETIELITLII